MSYEDATASWSGYTFQGEVALLFCLRKMNDLKTTGNYDSNFHLRLEEDEDFSLNADDLIVYQVKAMVNEDFPSYASTIKNLIQKYVYSISVVKDTTDGRKRITTERATKRKKPIKSRLITRKAINNYVAGMATIDSKYRVTTDLFDTIHGLVTLDNINQLINDEIEKYYLLNPGVQQKNVEVVRRHLTQKISDYVKERHETKIARQILFSEIEDWILNCPNSITEEIFWHHIKKHFIEILLEEAVDRVSKDCHFQISALEKMSWKQIKILFSEYISTYKNIPQNFDDFTYLNVSGTKNVIGRILHEALISPTNSEKISYDKEGVIYQITNHSVNPNGLGSKLIREVNLFLNSTQKFNDNYIVTEHLSMDKDDIPNDITEIDKEDNSIIELNSILCFMDIETAITKINT